ncbi:MAG: hypothetical protein IKV56_02250 [Kiritimatiellae bacterium]|nr:hypothetical protein [Kiritimatiellia bacterium]
MFDINSSEARLLLEIALMATNLGRFSSAAKILAALEVFRPAHASLAVAKAMLMMSMGDMIEAVEYIDREALPVNPGSAMLMVFKGMALLKCGRDADALRPLEEASKSEADEAAAKMAKDLINDRYNGFGCG